MRVSSTTVIVLAMAASAAAFTSPLSLASSRPSALSMSLEPQQPDASDESSANDLFQTATAAVLPVLLAASPANAAGPDWGIFEGKAGSLLHPIMMGSLLIYAISTGLLGFQWRRQRTLGDDMKALQNQLPSGVKTASDVQSAMQEEGANVAQLQAALPVAQELEALQAERKELASKGPRDQHFGQGAMLAFLGTAFAIEGPLNTYARAGKLFPGPHLYAGAGLVCLWALAVSTVPAMQKGDDTARTVHIAANVAGLGLFGWQVVSGIPILLKVWELTKWP